MTNNALRGIMAPDRERYFWLGGREVKNKLIVIEKNRN